MRSNRNINVEVEGGEISLINSHGDIVIIPKNKSSWVKSKIRRGCDSCIDSFVDSLPSMVDYAADGSVIPPGKKILQYLGGDSRYDVKTVAPRSGSRLNEDGTQSTHLMSYSSGDGKYYAYPTLFQNRSGRWVQKDDKKNFEAFKMAKKRNEIFEFDDEKSAKEFAAGSWKDKYKEYDVNSQEYRNLYNSGTIATYDKNRDLYLVTPLPEQTITAEAPQWLKDKRELERTSPTFDKSTGKNFGHNQ